MTPDTQEQLTRALKMLNDAAEGGGNFVLDQAPELARELVAYEFCKSWFWVVMAIFGSIVAISMSVKFGIKAYKETDDELALISFLLFALSFFLFVLFSCHIGSAVKATVAPRLVILDYVKEVVK